MDRSRPAQQLEEGLAAIDLALDPRQASQLLELLALVQKWGEVYNLTTILDPEEGVTLHLLDSLVVSPYLAGTRRILDVGTGAGFPGLPLAIANPDRQFVLLDRSAKKIRFVRQAAMSLGLSNVEAVACRIEDYDPPFQFDAILARALARLSLIRSLVARLLAPSGRILALKGHLDDAELAPLGDALEAVHPLALPGRQLTRHVVILR